MTALIESPSANWTLARLYQRFGAMLVERIVFDPAPGTATEEDVDRIEREADELCELIDGVLVRKPMSSYESLLAGRVLTLLNLFVLPRKLGWVLGEAGMLRLWPGRIRIPDVSFISRDQPPNHKFPKGERVASLFPDLAVEVLSDSNTREEMESKLDDYFRSGTRLVWIIDPRKRTADVYTSAISVTHVMEDGLLIGDPVLPELSISLSVVLDVDGPLE